MPQIEGNSHDIKFRNFPIYGGAQRTCDAFFEKSEATDIEKNSFFEPSYATCRSRDGGPLELREGIDPDGWAFRTISR